MRARRPIFMAAPQPTKFGGLIKEDATDSTPYWPPEALVRAKD